MDTPMETKEQSDFEKLKNSLNSLRETLSGFNGDINTFKSHVFKEEEKATESQPADIKEKPTNIILDLKSTVEICFDIQSKIRDDFEKIQRILN